MTDADPVLGAIAAQPPDIDAGRIAATVGDQFGLEGTWSGLVSERDQNFRLDTPGGGRYVVKVVGRAEGRRASAMQLAALRHLESVAFPGVPRVVPTRDGGLLGRVSGSGGDYRLRVVTFVEGIPLSVAGTSATHAAGVGSRLARLARAFSTFEYAGDNPDLLWDLQRAGQLRAVLAAIDDAGARRLVTRALDDFDARALPGLDRLPRRAIHGDPNPDNILLDAASGEVTGLIDFGDMVIAPRIVDVAIAAAYQRGERGDPLEFISPLLGGYRSVLPLGPDECELFYDLVRARLATTIALLHWRLGARPAGDPYRRKTLAQESGAQRFLDALDTLGRASFNRKLSLNQ